MMSQLILGFIDLHFVHLAMWESSFFCRAHGGVTLAKGYDDHPQNCVCENKERGFSLLLISAVFFHNVRRTCQEPKLMHLSGHLLDGHKHLSHFSSKQVHLKQAQIHGLNYRADTSSVSRVRNLARRAFAWRESGDGARRLTTHHFWPKCRRELKGLFVRTQHKPM